MFKMRIKVITMKIHPLRNLQYVLSTERIDKMNATVRTSKPHCSWFERCLQ